MRGMVAPTPATRLAGSLIVLIVLCSALFLLWNYTALPSLLPVHFKRNGFPNGWQFKTLPRVMMPVLVQVALTLTFGAIGALLLSRPHGEQDIDAPDVRAAAVATEAIIVIALIWVAFQAYASVALVNMWLVERAGLGAGYTYLEIACVLITGLVATRAHVQLGRPEPRPFVEAHWRFGHLYKNAEDPALFVPTRDGSRWTLNFGRPLAAALLGLIIAIGVIGPTAILALALR